MYREMYYEGGISSVYLWDLEEGGAGKEVAFAGAVLLKKSECGFAAFIAIFGGRIGRAVAKTVITPGEAHSCPIDCLTSSHAE